MDDAKKLLIGVLGSGRGSNLRAILDACKQPNFPARVCIVISDVSDAGILQIARDHGIEAKFIAPGKFKTKLEPEIESQYATALRKAGVELVALAGFMRMIRGEVLRVYAGRIMNLHPALLPAFPGLKSWKQALDHGAKAAGCTVHFVDNGMDTGPIILQAAVPILETDTPETLHARIQEQEHLLYPKAIRLHAEGRLRIEGRRVRILESKR